MPRRGLVGQGYMPKGGRVAAAAHNERVRAAAPVSDAPQVVPVRGRASDRVLARLRIVEVALCVQTVGDVAFLLWRVR